MTVWSDPEFTAEVVRRYLAGDGPTEIARCFDLTRCAVLSKMKRLGHARSPASAPRGGRHAAHAPDAAREASRAAARAFPRAPRPTHPEQIIAALRAGASSTHEIARATGLTVTRLGSPLAQLMRRGSVQRLNPGKRWARYGLVAEGSVAVNLTRGEAQRISEDAYVAGRRAGRSKADLVASLGISQTSAVDFEEAFRMQTTSPNAGDSSCPKFAHHDRHLGQLTRIGAFPVMPSLAELRGLG